MSLYVPWTEALQAANTLGTEGGVLILRVYLLERCWKKVWKVYGDLYGDLLNHTIVTRRTPYYMQVEDKLMENNARIWK